MRIYDYLNGILGAMGAMLNEFIKAAQTEVDNHSMEV